ncbi:MAG: hypothetical protein WAV41_03085 [Microgenomates group bacterium]
MPQTTVEAYTKKGKPLFKEPKVLSDPHANMIHIIRVPTYTGETVIISSHLLVHDTRFSNAHSLTQEATLPTFSNRRTELVELFGSKDKITRVVLIPHADLPVTRRRAAYTIIITRQN